METITINKNKLLRIIEILNFTICIVEEEVEDLLENDLSKKNRLRDLIYNRDELNNYVKEKDGE